MDRIGRIGSGRVMAMTIRTAPYGVHFKLGLHHVKNGYFYDEETPGENVRICANKNLTVTQTKEESNDKLTNYRVYTGELTGTPTDTDDYGNVRYCYIAFAIKRALPIWSTTV